MVFSERDEVCVREGVALRRKGLVPRTLRSIATTEGSRYGDGWRGGALRLDWAMKEMGVDAASTGADVAALEAKGREIRRLVLRSVHHAGAGHIGGPLSAADLLATLYFGVLRIDPERPDWPDRDRFILSKGHSAIGWYAVLALRGFFPVEELETFDALDSRLQGHPDMTATPGVDMSTGSLGQGLSAGLGMALGARLAGKDFHTWVIIGDGELQEGQVWEAIQVAPRYRLGNLTAILDHNKLSQYGWTYAPEGFAGVHREPPIVDPGGKIALFGWNVVQIDGHNVEEILAACTLARHAGDRPTLIVAHTTKGRGVGFMEGMFRWHTGPMTEEQIEEALAGLAEPSGSPASGSGSQVTGRD